MANRIHVSVDPGTSGAYALFHDGVLTDVEDVPTLARKSGGDAIDGYALHRALRIIVQTNHGAAFHAFMELTGAMPGQGVSSTWKFGNASGRVEGVLQSLGFPITYVSPAKWKKAFGLIGRDKDCARTMAVERFPHVAHKLARKKDVGRADAALIGLYGVNEEK